MGTHMTVLENTRIEDSIQVAHIKMWEAMKKDQSIKGCMIPWPDFSILSDNVPDPVRMHLGDILHVEMGIGKGRRR